MFVSPNDHVLPRAFSLTESCSNNVAEYNALITSLQLDQQMGLKYLKAYGDTKLIINQTKGEYEVWYEDLILYHHAAIQLANTFDGFYISYVSRLQNTSAGRCPSRTCSYIGFTSQYQLPFYGSYSSSTLPEVQFRG